MRDVIYGIIKDFFGEGILWNVIRNYDGIRRGTLTIRTSKSRLERYTVCIIHFNSDHCYMSSGLIAPVIVNYNNPNFISNLENSIYNLIGLRNNA